MDKTVIMEAFTAFLDKHFGSVQGEQNTVEVTKSVDEEQRMALFVVLEPDAVDAHGDTYSADEVEKACNNFNEHCMKANLFHRVETDSFKIAQSFITPASFDTDDGRHIQKGSWLTWCRFDNDALWGMVKEGTVSGISIGGRAQVEELT